MRGSTSQPAFPTSSVKKGLNSRLFGLSVIPAKEEVDCEWIPACARMTAGEGRFDFCDTLEGGNPPPVMAPGLREDDSWSFLPFCVVLHDSIMSTLRGEHKQSQFRTLPEKPQ